MRRKHMYSPIGSFFVSLTLLFPSLPMRAEGPAQATPAPAATTPDPATTGKKIGTIVSAAVDTAFPIIGKIMGLFSSPSNPNQKVTQSATQTAVTKAQTDYKAAAKQQLQPVTGIAKELGVIEAFSEAGVKANTNLITIKDLLAATSSPDYAKVSLEWNIAKNQLADVLIMKSTDISVVRDPIIRQRILDLQDARRDLMTRIDASLNSAKTPSASTRQDLQMQTAAMAGLLTGFNTLASIELSFLQDDLASLANWANGAAGAPSPAKKDADKKLLNIIDQARSAATTATSKP